MICSIATSLAGLFGHSGFESVSDFDTPQRTPLAYSYFGFTRYPLHASRDTLHELRFTPL
jgi:hypothetical protein